ncbi:PAS domain S-box protein [Sulfitobacter donghicola]|uniref:Sensor protein FixL n=1 Tax=Sulfitobacter donghicola DSW-25 = KCTC 12864 = JCM 14565 TaxID=1300350 RepID=A0A073IGF5_9RHOB|nr:PAS domain S-box protein [Sulfitobacter donghicola]KEJ88546.1 histidine kinase [Sulfitobacter donghicola DSW-25 = KCTC 12864 = JCM 14565]KIN69568.1 Sensor histidine kinase/response regulator [Sulfitobacter donghicola DSW-25 = KCTC 12864 = JCM 14565]
MVKETEDSAVLNAILDAAVDAMIVSDHKGIIERANAAAAKMFQYETSEMIGKSLNILMPAALAAQHDGFMSHHIKTGEKRIIGIGRDVEGQRKDGTTFPLHLSVGNSEIAGQPLFVGILHDQTEQKATEEILARSQRLDAIGQMTGGIAHDFNNLLTVIIGNLELLEMQGAGARQLPLIKDALESAEMGADLTSRLMMFAGRSNLKPEEADLQQLCTDTLEMIKMSLGANYQIRTDFAANLDRVLIDPTQFKSALMNLAFNARDAMGHSGELLISTSNVTIDDRYIAQEIDIEPGHYVRLSISDTGDGMSAEAQKRAFEPFFTTKTETGGTGLGLAMVHGFMRQSAGHVTLYSELGLGTSFGLYFPTLTDDAKETPASDTDLQVNPKPESYSEGKVVLVVEDNAKVRKLSLERIQSLGFETLEADSGDAAYQLLLNGARVDLVFSDLVMPGSLNGYDLAAKVEAEFPNLKVLLTSGYAGDVISSRLPQSHPFELLHKPYRQAELVSRLKQMFSA